MSCSCGGEHKCRCGKSKAFNILVLIGGLNWGLVGVGMLMNSNLNIVNILLGSMPTVEAIVYLLVGISAVVCIFGCKCKKCKEACKDCNVGQAPSMQGASNPGEHSNM